MNNNMLVFCFIIIFTVTFIKTQKPSPVKLIENTDWIPTDNFTEKTSPSTSYEKIFENGKKILSPFNILNFDTNYRASLDSFQEKNGQNQSEELIAPRFFHSRIQIDGGGKNVDSTDAFANIKHNPFEIISTDIPLTETFREKFLEKKIKDNKNDNQAQNKNQNKVSASIKKDNYVPDEKFKITEKDAVAVRYTNEKFQTTKLHPQQHFLLNVNNSSTKPHKNTNVKQIILKNNTEKNETSANRRLQSNATISKEKQAVVSPKQNQMESVILKKETETQLRSEKNDKKKTSTSLEDFDLKAEESSIHLKQSEETTNKNDTEAMNQLARFRKQALNWQNKAQTSTSITRVTGSSSNPQSQTTGIKYDNHRGYSTLPLRIPQPLPAYYDNNQKVTNYNYSPTRQPIKITQQPKPSQNFKPATPDQNPYFSDRPPPEFEAIKRQDQEFFYPGGQPYPSQQTVKNSTFDYAPSPGYYYPSVNYQPSKLPEELTTQVYPPLGAPPSQTYQIPGYNYGPPEPSQNYGPPSQTYVPPSQTYGPPSQTYGPPSQTYGPPSYTYGPPPQPAEQLQEQKPYLPQSYSRLVLNDEQCVMNREVKAEALVEVVLSFKGQGSQLRNCALMFSSDFNIAVTSMIQSDKNSSTNDLVRQLNLRMFAVQPKGFITENKNPWYMNDTSAGLTFGRSGTVIITFQSSTSMTFRILVFSYKDITPRIPVVFNYVLTANATAPLNESELVEPQTNEEESMLMGLPTNQEESVMDLPTSTEENEEKILAIEQENPMLLNNMQPELLVVSLPEVSHNEKEK